MSESEPVSRSARNRERRTLVIRRQDHIGDAISIAWLAPAETVGDAIIGRLQDYLGSRVRIEKAEISRDTIEVEVEVRGWREEADRMARAARDLAEKGGRRAALQMCQESLQIDSLNIEAMSTMGFVLAALDRDEEALQAFKRAREFGASGVEPVLQLVRCAMRLKRLGTAVQYVHEALRIDPQNREARRTLRAIKRQMNS
jgi:tetratricopeptide (TPR) repeat protein